MNLEQASLLKKGDLVKVCYCPININDHVEEVGKIEYGAGDIQKTFNGIEFYYLTVKYGKGRDSKISTFASHHVHNLSYRGR